MAQASNGQSSQPSSSSNSIEVIQNAVSTSVIRSVECNCTDETCQRTFRYARKLNSEVMKLKIKIKKLSSENDALKSENLAKEEKLTKIGIENARLNEEVNQFNVKFTNIKEEQQSKENFNLNFNVFSFSQLNSQSSRQQTKELENRIGELSEQLRSVDGKKTIQKEKTELEIKLACQIENKTNLERQLNVLSEKCAKKKLKIANLKKALGAQSEKCIKKKLKIANLKKAIAVKENTEKEIRSKLGDVERVKEKQAEDLKIAETKITQLKCQFDSEKMRRELFERELFENNMGNSKNLNKQKRVYERFEMPNYNSALWNQINRTPTIQLYSERDQMQNTISPQNISNESIQNQQQLSNMPSLSPNPPIELASSTAQKRFNEENDEEECLIVGVTKRPCPTYQTNYPNPANFNPNGPRGFTSRVQTQSNTSKIWQPPVVAAKSNKTFTSFVPVRSDIIKQRQSASPKNNNALYPTLTSALNQPLKKPISNEVVGSNGAIIADINDINNQQYQQQNQQQNQLTQAVTEPLSLTSGSSPVAILQEPRVQAPLDRSPIPSGSGLISQQSTSEKTAVSALMELTQAGSKLLPEDHSVTRRLPEDQDQEVVKDFFTQLNKFLEVARYEDVPEISNKSIEKSFTDFAKSMMGRGQDPLDSVKEYLRYVPSNVLDAHIQKQLEILAIKIKNRAV